MASNSDHFLWWPWHRLRDRHRGDPDGPTGRPGCTRWPPTTCRGCRHEAAPRRWPWVRTARRAPRLPVGQPPVAQRLSGRDARL